MNKHTEPSTVREIFETARGIGASPSSWHEEAIELLEAHEEAAIAEAVRLARIEIMKNLRDLPNAIAVKVYGNHEDMSENDFQNREELDKWIGKEIATIAPTEEGK